jgi:hypothetical protein
MLTLKKTLCCMAALTTFEAAAEVCRPYEYAELKDMQQGLLLEKYCQYQSDMYAVLKVGTATVRSGAPNRNYAGQVLATSERCAAEMDRVARILDVKFGVKQPSCQ